MRHIIWDEYNVLFPHNETLLAHIWQECPVLTWDCGYKEGSARNDRGYGVGIAQWNIHIRSPFVQWFDKNGYYYRPSNPAYTTQVRADFFEAHPHMKTWDGQLRHYLTEMQGCFEKYKSLDHCIWRWNSKSEGYLWKIKNKNVPIVRKLLNS